MAAIWLRFVCSLAVTVYIQRGRLADPGGYFPGGIRWHTEHHPCGQPHTCKRGLIFA